MSQKPSIPKGTRDFLPLEMARRNYIFRTITEVFSLYGFLPIETPAMENLPTLLGKYGEEGDRLIFKILNSGDFITKVPDDPAYFSNSARLSSKICEKGLRYDLTVPFARFVVQHQNEITFPFRRYQIQPVWRADRPQKGRYREFFQCDVDVIGSDSLVNEIELARIIDDVFSRLKFSTVVKINNRKVLAGMVEVAGASEKFIPVMTAIDKLEKTGKDNVVRELFDKGLSEEAVNRIMSVTGVSGDNNVKLSSLKEILGKSETGMKGIDELEFLFGHLESYGLGNEFVFDAALARGLDYYTGTIFEVKAKDMEIGSICGGGRYDNLTEVFGLSGVSGVGISFGADRIYDVMLKLDVFPGELLTGTRVMFANFGEEEASFCLEILGMLRKAGISAELYPEAAKMKKQMTYADRKNIPYVALIGDTELKGKKVTLKNMETGSQQQISPEELTVLLQDKISPGR